MRTIPFLLLVLSTAACVTTTTGGPRRQPPPQQPREKNVPVFAGHTKQLFERAWTTRFMQPGLLIADEIVIEGPEDLAQHVAVGQDPDVFESATWTTKDGLRQETSVKQGIQGREVRGQLDAWTIVAMKRLHVLQRPGDAPVVIRATGDARFVPVDASDEDEQSGPQLLFRGEHVR